MSFLLLTLLLSLQAAVTTTATTDSLPSEGLLRSQTPEPPGSEQIGDLNKYAAPKEQESANSLIQGIADADPELAKMMDDPVKLIKWLNSTDGEETLEKLSEGMQDVLNDPEKIKSLLQDFESDPLFEDLEQRMPELVKEIKQALVHLEL